MDIEITLRLTSCDDDDIGEHEAQRPERLGHAVADLLTRVYRAAEMESRKKLSFEERELVDANPSSIDYVSSREV